jgi:hypothetical protein
MKKSTFISTAIVLALSITLTLSSQQVTAESLIIGSNSDSRLELQVHSFNTASSIDYYPYTPDTNGYIWAWVDISIKNIGTEEVSTNVLYAYLKDNNNYQYRARPTANAPLQLKLIDLLPGEIQRGLIYWEIPPDAEITSFIWHDYVSNIAIPAPSPSPSPSPTPTPTPTFAPTPTPTESPGTSGFPLAASIALIIVAIIVIALILKRKR